MRGFKAFLLRGNVVELAVAVVVGVAFGLVVTAFVKDLVTPLIAAMAASPTSRRCTFTVNNSKFLYGDFLNALLAFVIVAAVIYFFVVVPYTALMARIAERSRRRTPRPRSAPSARARSRSTPGAARSAGKPSRRTPSSDGDRPKLPGGLVAQRERTVPYSDLNRLRHVVDLYDLDLAARHEVALVQIGQESGRFALGHLGHARDGGGGPCVER